MHRYRVTDTDAGSDRLALRDSEGRLHVALAMSPMPAVGTDLQGSLPGLGFRVLLCDATECLVRVRFERLDCDPAWRRAGDTA